MTEQRGNELTWRRGNGAARQRIDVATRQRSNAATDWRGDAATEQRGNGLTRQRGNGLTRQRGNGLTSDLLNENLSKSWMPKKLAWTDLDRVSFQKICQRVKCRNQKIGVDWSRQSQKRPLQRQVSLMFFFTTGHLGVAEAFCTSMACPWQEVQ
jgi:hypothetical protein